MSDETLECIDRLDATVFTGDVFHDEENRKQLRKFLPRWERALDALQRVDEDCRENAHAQPEITNEMKEKGLKEIEEAKWTKDEWDALNLKVSQPNGYTAHCILTLRPTYCDRGHIQLNIEAAGMGLDNSDSFPRFFFSFEEANAHVREFLRWRLYKVRSNPHKLESPKEKIEQLKKIGDQTTKSYKGSIPENCITIVDGFLFTYVKEETMVGLQPTLSISHLSGNPFEKFGYEEEIEEIFGVPASLATSSYPQRGFTRQYLYTIVSKEE